MVRRPGEVPDEEEPPGGRAAERRREHLEQRYGTGDPTDADLDGSDEDGDVLDDEQDDGQDDELPPE